MRLIMSALLTILLLANFTSCDSEDNNRHNDRNTSIEETPPPTDDNSSTDTPPKNEDNSSAETPPKEETPPSKDIVFPSGEYGSITLTPDWTVPKGAIFIDIRNDWERVEFRAVGTVGGAVYEYREQGGDGSERYLTSDFYENVLTLAGSESREIILICHSASRTSKAAKFLSDNGFTNVWHIANGMNSWVQVKPNETIFNTPL